MLFDIQYDYSGVFFWPERGVVDVEKCDRKKLPNIAIL